MCLAIVALDAHPRYAIVVAANRDEFHARPTARAHWWNDAHGRPLLAGRDLEQHGTWLGVARSGRFAFVTNVREPSRHDPRAPSRGALVPAVLRDARDLRTAVAAVVDEARAYNGFNLVAGEPGAAGSVITNIAPRPAAGSAAISPPCATTTSRESDRPNPTLPPPGGLVV